MILKFTLNNFKNNLKKLKIFKMKMKKTKIID